MSSVIECHNCKALYVTRQAGECPYCVVQRSNTEIDRLKRELEEATKEIQGLGEIIIDHKRQFASAREKLKKKDEAISKLCCMEKADKIKDVIASMEYKGAKNESV